MQAPVLDDLGAMIRARMAAAVRDKALYDRNGARLNGQLLQGEINMGNVVLAWLDAHRTGADLAADGEAEEESDVGESK